jgi:hypothetical protein
MEYDELQQKVDRYTNITKARRKANYRYARSKGFTPKEAMVLCQLSKEEIDKTVADRDNGLKGG